MTNDKRPMTNSNTGEPEASESLKEVARELETLKSTVISQLSREIEQLQAKKARLLYETEQLELQRVQQLQWQQQLAAQIAPAIADQLQELLQQKLSAISRSEENAQLPPQLDDYNDNAERAIASLDSTLRTTFRTLQQDMSSYQSALSQQLGQMHSLEQQGTAILETLVERLRQELEAKMNAAAKPNKNGATQQPLPSRLRPSPPPQVGPISAPSRPIPPPSRPVVPSPPPPQTPYTRGQGGGQAASKPKVVAAGKARLGLILILIYSLALSLQNVVTRVIVKSEPSDIFGGIFRLGSYISPSLGNSVLLLLLRMIFVVPGMLILAEILYPRTRSEINSFMRSRDRNLWLQVIGSGFFLFLSQVLIYIAFGNLSAGVALTVFFIFPIITVLLSWILLGDRPSFIRSMATAAVFIGVALIAFAADSGATTISPIGLVTSAGAGITFAFYVLLIQTSAKRIHPIPLSAINFLTILIFSILSFMLPFINSSVEFDPQMRSTILICGFILGGLSLLSYLVNNIGISLIGAARASIFGATGPAFTAILALLIIGEGLNFQEIFGMLVVTAGVAAVSAERLMVKPKSPKSS
ncbi:MAG: EamA family transporter [Cyanobacteriota bacterium]|nr:EamA family transporter [Cyanobacteriota bacterium]